MANTIGVVGGGQLGRMLALAGTPLGLRFMFLDPSPNAPAARLGEIVVASYDDVAAYERLAQGADVVTVELEHVSVEALRRLEDRVPVRPRSDAVLTSQDRLLEKRFFERLGIPTAPFVGLPSEQEAMRAVEEVGLPAVLKARRGGYDGRGQAILRSTADVASAIERFAGHELILEALVPFERELSIVAARGLDGAIVFYPVVENLHIDGILRVTRAPAPGLTERLQERAEAYARSALEALDYVGVLTIELFQTSDGLLANELAPRVHNSGHWTIEGSETSQFENHLRAITGLPLGSTESRPHVAMLNIIGDVPDAALVLSIPGAHLHLYDKVPRPARKIGHVTITAPSGAALQERLHALRPALGIDAPMMPRYDVASRVR